MSQNVAEVEKDYIDIAKTRRQPHERQWLLNMAMYVGNQWVSYNSATKSLDKPKVPSYRVLLVANHIQPTVRTELGKVTSNTPKFFVLPNTTEDEDIRKAKVSEMLLEYLWYKMNLQQKFTDAVLWALVTGNGFIKVFWDSNAGKKFTGPEIGQDGMPVVDKNGMPKIRTYFLGEPVIEVVSPFELYFDPLATEAANARWVVHEKLRSKEYVKTKYNKDAEEMEMAATTYYQGTLPNFDYSGIGNVKGVMVRELWHIPCNKFPKGRLAVWINDEKIIDGEAPYKMTGLPIEQLKHILVPGQLYADCIVTQLTPVQVEYNKSRSQIIENKNLMSKPKWLIPQGALDQEITSMPGENIYYRNGLEPKAWTPPSLPQYVLDQLERNLQDINLISGINDVSRGQVPPNLRSGVAINFLQEQDNSRLAVTTRAYEALIARSGQKLLALCAQYFIEPRMVQIVGKDRQVDVKEIKNTDIDDSADVRVEAGSTMPTSKAAKQDFLIQLWQYKVIQDPQLMMKLLDMGGFEGMFEELEVDYNQANREQDRLQQGIMMDVHDFDNHMVHLSVHNKFRKTAAYEELPPEIQNVIAAHVKVHETMIMPQGGMVNGEQGDVFANDGGEGQPTDAYAAANAGAGAAI